MDSDLNQKRPTPDRVRKNRRESHASATGAALESGQKGSQRATPTTASGPEPADWRRVDAGAAIGPKVARLQSQKRKFRVKCVVTYRSLTRLHKESTACAFHGFGARFEFCLAYAFSHGPRCRLVLSPIRAWNAARRSGAHQRETPYRADSSSFCRRERKIIDP